MVTSLLTAGKYELGSIVGAGTGAGDCDRGGVVASDADPVSKYKGVVQNSRSSKVLSIQIPSFVSIGPPELFGEATKGNQMTNEK
ncbi:MAG TPA: hypothetical protein VGQ39_07680 [Pyrinomonadaceae bacterium]|jgi:hypothetical protein|nr:hypothetical protein [Pyrinomonadaceae bacterium]